MITIRGTLSALMSCPSCKKELTKVGQIDVVCSCGWVWAEPKIVNISSGIFGKAS